MNIYYYFTNLFMGGMQNRLLNLIKFCNGRHQIRYAAHSEDHADPIILDELRKTEKTSLNKISGWPDVIHIDSYSVFNKIRKYVPVKKCIVTLPSCRSPNRFRPRFFFRSPRYVAISNYTASQAGIKSNIIRCGADTRIFKPSVSIKKKYDVVIVGRFQAIKNHKLFIEICKQGDFSFLAIGGTSKRVSGHVNDIEKMMRAFAGSRPGSRVKSFVPCAELPDLINQAKVALVTSFNEGLGHNSIEPMACGLPVVGVDNGGTTEVVGFDEQCGYILPINRPLDEFVQKIRLCMDNKKMALNARNRIVRSFNLENEMNAYEKLYTEI